MSLLDKMFINSLTNRIERLLLPITHRLDRIMSTIAELDAALAANDTALNTLNDNLTALSTTAKQIDADVQALITKVNAGTTPADVAAQLSHVQSETAKLATLSTAVQGVTQELTADDTAANAPATPAATTGTTGAGTSTPAPSTPAPTATA
jgi:uncharacterized coiled-coil protein SlyX